MRHREQSYTRMHTFALNVNLLHGKILLWEKLKRLCTESIKHLEMEQRIIVGIFNATLPCPGEGGITPEYSLTSHLRELFFFQTVFKALVVTWSWTWCAHQHNKWKQMCLFFLLSLWEEKTHLRNSSALSAAEISVTLPFGIYKAIIKHLVMQDELKQHWHILQLKQISNVRVTIWD